MIRKNSNRFRNRKLSGIAATGTVGIFVLGHNANATIVHSGAIHYGITGNSLCAAPDSTYDVDLDSNASADLQFNMFYDCVGGSFQLHVTTQGTAKADDNGTATITKLALNSPINNTGTFNAVTPGAIYNPGNWINTEPGYIGVEFQISGNSHYGWVQVEMVSTSSATIIDWAYENVANTQVLAGQTSGGATPPINADVDVGFFGLSGFAVTLALFAAVMLRRKVPTEN